jgi:lysozyme
MGTPRITWCTIIETAEYVRLVVETGLKGKERQSVKNLLKLVKHFEGCSLTAYKCPAGYYTIGWGTTEGVKPGMKISQFMADFMLEKQLEELQWTIGAMPGSARLTESQIQALCSFAYNVGLGALKKSTLLKRALAGASEEEITRQFMRWTTAKGKELPGLVRRRKAEAHFFHTGAVKLA